MGTSKLSGAWGEALAAEYLLKKKYKLLATGYRCRFGEIDLIVANKKYLVFVEVKTRQKSIQAPPQENVNAAKQKMIVKAALSYLHSAKGLPCRDLECIFDVIAVRINGEQAEIEWIPQAYIPLYI